jgi:hypothetical protein
MKGHSQLVGDQLGLVDLAAAQPADINLLKAHDIGFTGRDDADNAPGRQLTVKPKASVNVVGQNAGQIG